MKSLYRIAVTLVAVPASYLCFMAPGSAQAQNARALDVRAARVIEHWTADRRAAATPRDLVIDERGLAYIRANGQALVPYGHNIAQAAPGGGGKDTTAPTVSAMSPAAGATVGASASFSATVADASGVKTVTCPVPT